MLSGDPAEGVEAIQQHHAVAFCLVAALGRCRSIHQALESLEDAALDQLHLGGNSTVCLADMLAVHLHACLCLVSTA